MLQISKGMGVAAAVAGLRLACTRVVGACVHRVGVCGVVWVHLHICAGWCMGLCVAWVCVGGLRCMCGCGGGVCMQTRGCLCGS